MLAISAKSESRFSFQALPLKVQVQLFDIMLMLVRTHHTNIPTMIVAINAKLAVTSPIFRLRIHPDKPIQISKANIPEIIPKELMIFKRLRVSKLSSICRPLTSAILVTAATIKQQDDAAEMQTIQSVTFFLASIVRIAAKNVAEKPPKKADNKISCCVRSTSKLLSISSQYLKSLGGQIAI